MLPFEDGSGQFHVPIRCEEEHLGFGTGLCAKCLVRQVRTERKLEEIGSKTTIGGMLPSYLHGKITDPVPYWSRIYDGAWFRLKVAGGSRVSELDMAKARRAAAAAYEGVEGAGTAEPAPIPVVRRGRKPKATTSEAAAVEAATSEARSEAAELPAPIETAAEAAPKAKKKGKTLAEKREEIRAAQPSILSFINTGEPPLLDLDAAPSVAAPVASPKEATPAAKPKPAAKKTPAKKTTAAAPVPPAAGSAVPAPKARVDVGTRTDPVEDVQTIHVVAKTLAGRQVYYEPKKDKVYDLRFKYLGRWDAKKGSIVAFPDSDAEP
jgi:hypothetical protein